MKTYFPVKHKIFLSVFSDVMMQFEKLNRKQKNNKKRVGRYLFILGTYFKI